MFGTLSKFRKLVNKMICEHCARIIRRVPKFVHITKTLMELHWLPVHQRVTFKILILTYQDYYKTAPQYLCDLIVPYANICN